MMDLYLILQFVKGRCHDNHIILSQWRQTDTTCILCHLPDGSMVSFRYYLLGGDIVAPSGLLARLSHTFSSFSLFFFTRSKAISVCTGPISRSFHQLEGICVNFLGQVYFFQFLKGRCHDNQFCFVLDSFAQSRSISGSAGPIFTIFAPYGRYWMADDQSDLFPIS